MPTAVDPLTCPPETRLSVPDAAIRAGVHYRTMRRYISEGRVRAERLGPRMVRVRAGDVDAAFSTVETCAP